MNDNLRELPRRVVDNPVEEVVAQFREIPTEEIAEVVILCRRKDGTMRALWSTDDVFHQIAYLEKLKHDLLQGVSSPE